MAKEVTLAIQQDLITPIHLFGYVADSRVQDQRVGPTLTNHGIVGKKD
jgi:hypothetical protein